MWAHAGAEPLATLLRPPCGYLSGATHTLIFVWVDAHTLTQMGASTKERKTVAPPPSGQVGGPDTRLQKNTSGDALIKELRGEHDAMQLKTFTRWWHSVLSPRGVEVTDLLNQIKPGVIGIQLIEALTGELAGRYNRKPKNQYQHLENQLTFIGQVKAKGLRLVNIGAEDLAAGERKLVLGLTWTLILRCARAVHTLCRHSRAKKKCRQSAESEPLVWRRRVRRRRLTPLPGMPQPARPRTAVRPRTARPRRHPAIPPPPCALG